MQAKNQKWSSILVQTGLYHPDNYGHHREKLEGLIKPTYEVKDMHDAIQLICDKEGLNIKV